MYWLRSKQKERIQVAAHSDVGQVRTQNEDAYGYFSEGADGDAVRLFVVADGMGGHRHGREASQAAVRIVRETFYAHPEHALEERLERALQAANAGVRAATGGGNGAERAGTTCTVLAWQDGEMSLAHVGDSRAYRIRDGRMKQLSNDHTWVAEMQREGILSAAEAQRHPRRHTLTRAVGTAEHVEADVVGLGPARPRDVFVLCTDGLAPVSEDELCRVALRYPPQEACERLVQRANDAGGYDNITVMLIRVD